MSKKLYKGIFNYSGQNIILYTYSHSENGAYLNFISQLAKKLNTGMYSVKSIFNGSKDNYRIERNV